MYRSLLLAAALTAAPAAHACALPAAAARAQAAIASVSASLEGAWTYRVEVPGRAVEGVLVFEASGAGLTGRIGQGTDGATIPVNDVVVAADGSATFWVTAPGDIGRVDFAVRADGDQLSGQMTAAGYAFALTGTRTTAPAPAGIAIVPVAPAASLAGAWAYTLDTPNGASSGRIELSEDASGALSGRLVRASGETSAFTSVTLDGDTLTLVYPSERYGSLAMRLVRTGDVLDGVLLAGQTEMPVRATRATN